MTAPVVSTTDADILLHDPDLLPRAEPWLFEPEALERGGYLGAEAGGRGSAWFVELPEGRCVLRHYRRGGLPARVLTDQYLYAGRGRSRPWREWHLLQTLRQHSLPVPRPVAARIRRDRIFYRGDLLVERIPAARPLTQLIREDAADQAVWDAVGRCIRRFHDHGVDHADLNADNILVDNAGTVHLVDLDQGRIRKPCLCWQRDNVLRLRRHLEKLRTQDQSFSYRDENMRALLIGYGPIAAG